MPEAKIRNLTVQAIQRAHLCFDVEGILDQMNIELGDKVTAAFDFDGFYTQLLTPVPGNLSLLYYDSAAIINDANVKASLLCWLRGEPAKLALDSAIVARQNAYYAKYANQGNIINQIQTYYGAGWNAKPALLLGLSELAQYQFNLLSGAYLRAGRMGVVKHTTSHLTGSTESKGESTATAKDQAHGTATTKSRVNSRSETDDWTYLWSAQTSVFSGNTWLQSDGESNDVGNTKGETRGKTTTKNRQGSTGHTTTESTGETQQKQHATNTDYGYRVPSAEAQAANMRAQVSLIDEQFAQFMTWQSLPHLPIVFRNELRAIDWNVKQMQVALIDTLLLTPIPGTVTGIFKNPGDYVRAGEPVIRIEQTSPVYLVGTLICRDMISVGDTAVVTSKLFGRGQSTTLGGGRILAARGHASELEWDVVIGYENKGGPKGLPIVPLNYHFDFDDTTVLIG